LHAGYPYEKRYPFLDRDLLEFLYAIPRTQLVRPGERRSLMRRALREIVPNEILNRRRKAYVTRAPLRSIARQCQLLSATRDDLVLSSLGIVVPELFFDVLEEARQGKVVSIVPLLRTLSMERWLRNLKANKSLKETIVSIVPSAEVLQTRESTSASASAGSGS
jgi:asparagine synthase (glutamine-hydrolysing)